jgi:hypothetical protein
LFKLTAFVKVTLDRHSCAKNAATISDPTATALAVN